MVAGHKTLHARIIDGLYTPLYSQQTIFGRSLHTDPNALLHAQTDLHAFSDLFFLGQDQFPVTYRYVTDSECSSPLLISLDNLRILLFLLKSIW